MSEIARLANLGKGDYITAVREAMNDDYKWTTMLHPVLVERTRWGLEQLIERLDAQLARGEREAADPVWMAKVATVKRYATKRMDLMPPPTPTVQEYVPSSSEESRKWRAFSAALARIVRAYDQDALERIEAPYGGLSALEWLQKREAKL